jgi:hypothetical protein
MHYKIKAGLLNQTKSIDLKLWTCIMLDFGGTLEHEDIKIFNTTGPAVCCQQHGYVETSVWNSCIYLAWIASALWAGDTTVAGRQFVHYINFKMVIWM